MGNALWRVLTGPLLLALMVVVPITQIVGLGMYLLSAGFLLPSSTSGVRDASGSCGPAQGQRSCDDIVSEHTPEQWDVPCR